MLKYHLKEQDLQIFDFNVKDKHIDKLEDNVND